jgi:hypothetical protein
MAKSGSNNDKPDTVPVMVAGVALVLAIPVGLLWWKKGPMVVYDLAMPLAKAGQIWRLLGQREYAERIYRGGYFFWYHAGSIGLFRFLHFANAALRPYAFIVVALFAVWSFRIARRDVKNLVRRKLSPEQLLMGSTNSFTGNIPVMHLREKIVRNQIPQWRRQRHAVEILQEERTSDGKPLLVDGEIDQERLEDWLRGIDPKRTTADGRLYSRHLGFQILRPEETESEHLRISVRLSDVGKTLFALFCAHAYGGPQGILDYQLARDQLNRSCAGHPLGIPNLTVANWIWQKYKNHPEANRLFLRHPWEYTYLCHLLHLAKEKGKMGHWDFMWLKPRERTLFYVLNTLGRQTPHPEAVMAFAQYEFEGACSKRPEESGRAPWMVATGPDGAKRHVPTIFTGPAVRGFMQEWREWQSSSDEAAEWWKGSGAWKQHSALSEMLKGLELDARGNPRFDGQQVMVSAPAHGPDDEDAAAPGTAGDEA